MIFFYFYVIQLFLFSHCSVSMYIVYMLYKYIYFFSIYQSADSDQMLLHKSSSCRSHIFYVFVFIDSSVVRQLLLKPFIKFTCFVNFVKFTINFEFMDPAKHDNYRRFFEIIYVNNRIKASNHQHLFHVSNYRFTAVSTTFIVTP